MTNNKKILLVDDDIDVITITQTILKHEGYEIITASNKKEGLEKAITEKPDLALLDVMMNTEFEGFELAELIKESSETDAAVLMQTSINILEANDTDVAGLAREYRNKMQNKDLDVILIQDPKSGNAGVDYINEGGNKVWLTVDGFIKKPVNSKVLLPAVKKLLR
ncbi:MAG: response regulator [Bacteroidota bacterium]|nr:response regulator [Bacteroidota bacterium]